MFSFLYLLNPLKRDCWAKISKKKFQCIVVDYLPTRKFPVIGQIAKWGLRTATVATLVGIYQFNTNDIGMF